MNPARLELLPGLWLDARRALWLEDARTLVVTDLHLGYAWTHRAAGQLLPLGTGTGTATVERLHRLVDDYTPAELIVLGDIIHGQASLTPVLAVLRQLLEEMSARTRLRLIRGNHDLRLPGVGVTLENEIRLGPHLLLHGHAADDELAQAHLDAAQQRGGLVILGHEHPALVLSDGVASRARCPCFLVADRTLVLPAFSLWSAGTDLRTGPYLSAYARLSHFTHAIPILAEKLLRLPL